MPQSKLAVRYAEAMEMISSDMIQVTTVIIETQMWESNSTKPLPTHNHCTLYQATLSHTNMDTHTCTGTLQACTHTHTQQSVMSSSFHGYQICLGRGGGDRELVSCAFKVTIYNIILNQWELSILLP